MRKLFGWLGLAAIAIAAGVGTSLHAAELAPTLDIYNADNAIFYAGGLTYPTAGCPLPNSCNTSATLPSGGFHSMGVLYTLAGSVSGTTGTGEQTPAGATYSLPANALDVAGRRVRATAVFTHAANGNNCTNKLYFGSEVISSGTISTTGVVGVFHVEAVKISAGNQQVTNYGYTATTLVTSVETAATETDTAAIVIKATVQGGTTGADCAVSDFYVEFMN